MNNEKTTQGTDENKLDYNKIGAIIFVAVLVVVVFFSGIGGNKEIKENKETIQAENRVKMEQELQAITKKTKVQALLGEKLKFESEITTAEAKIIETKQKIAIIQDTIDCLDKSTKVEDCKPKTEVKEEKK